LDVECALWRRGARSFYRLNVTAARATESTEFRKWPDGGGRTDEYEILAGTAGERAGRVVGGEKRLRHAATVGGEPPPGNSGCLRRRPDPPAGAAGYSRPEETLVKVVVRLVPTSWTET
jgi:hypothetical protein